MITFVNHFFVCNLFIPILILFIFAIKCILKKHLSARLQYNLWFILLFLLILPFIPLQGKGIYSLFSQFSTLQFSPTAASDGISQTSTVAQNSALNMLNDFTISVEQSAPSLSTYILAIVWLMGMVTMIILTFRARLNLYRVEQSALPLQNKKVYTLFEQCQSETGIKRNIPLYSTAYLKSPIIIGIFHPRIYVPIQLISDFKEQNMRYMLLHELQHYRHFDPLINWIANFYRIVYWFHPFVWYALKEMQSDRETACDFSVLQMLNENEYKDYGNTLINFAQKTAFTVFPFALGIGGDKKQITKRILNISSYHPQSLRQKIKGRLIYCLIAIVIVVFAPSLFTYGSDAEYYSFHPAGETVSYVDFSSFFKEYKGSFVLYDNDADTWQIYNKKYATKRVSPNSTYKIYDALIGLETGIISPNHSEMKWNGTEYPIDTWNTDQNLSTAMQNSVNWYFQNIDRQVGISTVQKYMEQMNYGNQNISENFPSYWLESSLKISPVEQVELLRKFYDNEFQFSENNINAVKSVLQISTSDNTTIYGKTGTGRVHNQDVNGWFVGYVEKNGHTYFFATNIQSDKDADGKTASEITFSILSYLKY